MIIIKLFYCIVIPFTFIFVLELWKVFLIELQCFPILNNFLLKIN